MRIAIDAGHGYDTAGKRSCPFVRDVTHTFEGQTVTVKKGEQYREHCGNVGVSVYLEKELKRCGFEIYKSGWNDSNAKDDKQLGSNPSSDVVARQTNIRKAKCDYSISVHFNASGSSSGGFNSGQGFETLYHSVAAKVGDGKKMAECINAELAKACTDQKNRGAKSGDGWGMCNSVGMGCKAAVIVELAFMTNQKEAENNFCNPEAWKRYAVAIAKGFCKYVGKAYVPDEIEVGDKVKIVPGATYGGSANGKPVPERVYKAGPYTVNKIQKNNGQMEGRLAELVSWVPIKFLYK